MNCYFFRRVPHKLNYLNFQCYLSFSKHSYNQKTCFGDFKSMLMSSKVLGRIKNNFDYLLWLRKPCTFTLQCSILLMSGFSLKGKRMEQLVDPSFLIPKIYSNLLPQWNISGKIPQFKTIRLSKRIVFGEYCLFFACFSLKKAKIKNGRRQGLFMKEKYFSVTIPLIHQVFPLFQNTSPLNYLGRTTIHLKNWRISTVYWEALNCAEMTVLLFKGSIN